MRVASRRAMEILLYLKDFVREGIKTIELEMICEDKIKTMPGMKPAFKGYNGFPYCLCVSVNDEVVHGMPSERVLKERDIISLDFGLFNDGYYGDVAMTYPVGEISKKVQKLLDVTESALYKGIDEAKGREPSSTIFPMLFRLVLKRQVFLLYGNLSVTGSAGVSMKTLSFLTTETKVQA